MSKSKLAEAMRVLTEYQEGTGTPFADHIRTLLDSWRQRGEALDARVWAEGKNEDAAACRELLATAEVARLTAEVERLRGKVAELDGEARMLIGCPCWCHTGDGPEPHGDCRECVRGAATPTAIDRDHTEALWREKWVAALDLMGSQAERAAQAEAALAEAKEACAAMNKMKLTAQAEWGKAVDALAAANERADRLGKQYGLMSDEYAKLQQALAEVVVVCEQMGSSTDARDEAARLARKALRPAAPSEEPKS